MPWSERIHQDPEILAGKPVIRGTRLAVEFIMELLEAGRCEADILDDYPGLIREDILACLSCRSINPRAVGYILSEDKWSDGQRKVTMFETLFNGTTYRIVRRRIGAGHQGWMNLDPADTLERAYAICKKDWDFYWSLCGVAPSRQMAVILE